MNQEIPKAPEVEKQKEYIPLNISEDSQKKSDVIDKAVAVAKGSPDQVAIGLRAAEAKRELEAASSEALRKAEGNQQTAFGKINLLA